MTDIQQESTPTENTQQENRKNNSLLAAASYIIFFLPLLTPEKNDEFVRYHMIQSIGFIIFAFVLRGFLAFLGGPPYTSLGSMLSWLLFQPAHVILIALLVLGMYNAYRGEKRPLPIIGKYIEKIAS